MTYAENLCSEGFDHNPLWKPKYWDLYWDYIPFTDFQRDYPTLADALEETKKIQSKHYLYKRVGKTRDMVHRIHLNHVHLSDQSLYEKTPSEKGFTQNKIVEVLKE